jgi:WD40 repeat protein
MKNKSLIFCVILVLFLSSCSLPNSAKNHTPVGQSPLNSVAVEQEPTLEISQNNSVKVNSLQEITSENASNLKEILTFGNGLIHDVASTMDGSSIIVSTSIGLFTYESGTLKLEHYFETDQSMGTIAVSPDNNTIAVSSGNRLIHFFDIKSKVYLGNISYIDQLIYGFAFVNNGDEFVTAEVGESVHYWDVTNLNLSRSITIPLKSTISFAASADGKMLAIETYKDDLDMIHIWDVENGEEIMAFSKPKSFTKIKMAFSPDNKLLITGLWSRLLVWNLESGELQSDLSSFYEEGSLFFFSFSRNGENFMAFSSEKVDLWDSKNFNLITSVPFNLGSETLCAASTPDNETVVVGTLDGTITTYEISSGQKTGSVNNHMSVFTSVAVSSDTNWVAAGDILGRIFVYDLKNHSLKFILDEHDVEIKALVFSLDGKILASLSEEEKIIIWDVSSGSLIDTFFGFAESIETIDISRDGTILAAGSYRGKNLLVGFTEWNGDQYD